MGKKAVFGSVKLSKQDRTDIHWIMVNENLHIEIDSTGISIIDDGDSEKVLWSKNFTDERMEAEP